MNPYQKQTKAYNAASVTTQDQGTLILMLYDGAIRFCKVAILKLNKGDLEATHTNLLKAKNIVSELMSSLNADKAGEVGKNLEKLYLYIFNRLIDANTQKNKEYIDEIIALLTEMKDGWQYAVEHKKTVSQSGRFDQNGEVKTLNING